MSRFKYFVVIRSYLLNQWNYPTICNIHKKSISHVFLFIFIMYYNVIYIFHSLSYIQFSVKGILSQYLMHLHKRSVIKHSFVRATRHDISMFKKLIDQSASCRTCVSPSVSVLCYCSREKRSDKSWVFFLLSFGVWNPLNLVSATVLCYSSAKVAR